MYSLPHLRAARMRTPMAATLACLALIATLVGGLALLQIGGGEELRVLDARAAQAVEPSFTVAPAEQAPMATTTDELPEEMAPTF